MSRHPIVSDRLTYKVILGVYTRFYRFCVQGVSKNINIILNKKKQKTILCFRFEH